MLLACGGPGRGVLCLTGGKGLGSVTKGDKFHLGFEGWVDGPAQGGVWASMRQRKHGGGRDEHGSYWEAQIFITTQACGVAGGKNLESSFEWVVKTVGCWIRTLNFFLMRVIRCLFCWGNIHGTFTIVKYTVWWFLVYSQSCLCN